VARRWNEPEPGKQLELAVDRHVPHARRLEPLRELIEAPKITPAIDRTFRSSEVREATATWKPDRPGEMIVAV
jgi:hypothetical protein